MTKQKEKIGRNRKRLSRSGGDRIIMTEEGRTEETEQKEESTKHNKTKEDRSGQTKANAELTGNEKLPQISPSLTK